MKSLLNPVAPALLVLSVRTLACLGASALFFTKELNIGFFVFYGVFLGVGFIIQRSSRWLSIISRIQPLFAVLSFGFALVDFFRFSQSFLLVVAHFLLCIQGARLLALRTLRDNLGSLLLSSLMMVSSATLSVEWSFFAILVVYVPAVIWALMVHNLAFENEGLSKEACVGKTGASAHDSGQTSVASWQKTAPNLRMSALVAVAITMVCCSVVFIFFPRFNFQGFRGQYLQPVVKTGLSSSVDLNDSGTVYEDNTIVMRIEWPNKFGQWDGYLRGQTLGEFDGSEWKRSEWSSSAVYGSRGLVALRHTVSASEFTRWPRATVYLESMDTPMLFLPTNTIAIDIERPFLFQYRDGSVTRVPRDTWRVRYEAIMAPLPNLSDPLLERSVLLSLGPLASSDELKNFVGRLVGREARPFEMARLLEEHLAGTYRYTLTIPVSTRVQPIESFLYDHKSGHCEYFASALALMLRVRGIPTRVVTGFLSKEWNERGRYVVVRSRHAHAWVEAYFPERGWVRFDPSPRQSLEAPPGPAWRRHVSEWADHINLIWNRTILSYDMERQLGMLMSFNRKSKKITVNFDRLRFRWPFFRENSHKKPTFFGSISAGLLVLLMVLGAGAAGLFIWRKTRPRHWPREMCQVLLATYKKAGVYAPHLSFEEQFARLQFKTPQQTQTVRFLVEAYTQMRFDPRFIPSADFIARVKSELRSQAQ